MISSLIPLGRCDIVEVGHNIPSFGADLTIKRSVMAENMESL